LEDVEKEENVNNETTTVSDAPEEMFIDSGVEGLSADGVYKDKPVFDVSPETFFKNMKMERNRTRFPNKSKASQFMKSTKYRKPFYMRSQDNKGNDIVKQIK
jgi:hypothetical protein